MFASCHRNQQRGESRGWHARRKSRSFLTYWGQSYDPPPDSPAPRPDDSFASQESDEPPPKRTRFDGWDDVAAETLTLQQEIDLYILAGRAENDDPSSLLPWWKTRQLMFPKLAKVARAVLCIPATSSSSERNFSRAGLIVTDKRSRIAPEVVNNLLVIHNYYLVRNVSFFFLKRLHFLREKSFLSLLLFVSRMFVVSGLRNARGRNLPRNNDSIVDFR